MYRDGKIIIGKSTEGEEVYLNTKMANRHGLIAGATGTGKTVTLKVMAESFSDAGVPVFFADVKGDLAGCCDSGVMNENISSRLEKLGISTDEFQMKKYPVNFWDVYGEKGMPLRTTITEMGPLLLGRVLGLTDNQCDLLTVVFKIADDMLNSGNKEGLIIDTKDLKAFLNYVAENSSEFSAEYGNIAKASINVIIRAIVALESEGADKFFGEPALSIGDFIARDCDGKGIIQILDCQKLINNPTMYSTFLLWLLSELQEKLPEVGDLDKPKMVFFFDEAHMLFANASKDLLARIEQVVKLIRSKGVGIYFVTQVPKDIPDGVLAQLGNKVQHALHAYTPKDQTAVKAAAQSYRENPAFSTYDTIMELQTGEAIVSVLDEKGVPTIVQRCIILPPQSLMGGISDDKRQQEINANFLYTKYSNAEDPESAYELFTKRYEEVKKADEEKKAEEEKIKQEEKEAAAAQKAAEKEQAAAEKASAKEAAAAEKKAAKEAEAAEKAASKKKTQTGKAVKSAAKSVASSTAGTIGRELGKNLGKSVGGTFGKTLGGNIGASLGRGIIGTLFKL